MVLIQQSIYGVDLDASAVDISRLRLWLSLIVDYDKEEANEIKALPNLDYKIMQGNSLVENFNGIKLFNDDYINQGDDSETEINNLKQRQSKIQADYFALHKNNQLTEAKKNQLNDESAVIAKLLKTLLYPSTDKTALYDGDMFNLHSEEKRKVEQLYKLHDEFFACTPAKKQTIRQQISELEWELIEATLKERRDTAALDQIKILREKNEKPFFLWKLNFPEVFRQGGFDIVIGNPPYVLSRKTFSNEEKLYYKKNYEWIYEKINLYLLFVEKSNSLMNLKGTLSFIIPNSWLGVDSASKLRKHILENHSILKIINLLGETFKNAGVEPSILIFSKNKSTSKVGFATTINKEIFNATFSEILQTEWLNNRNYLIDITSNEDENIILKKIRSNSILLSSKYDVRVGLQAYETGKGNPKQTIDDVKNHIFDYNYQYDKDTFQYLGGSDVMRYELRWSGIWLRYGKWLSQTKSFDQFSEPRILIREITSKSPTVLQCTYTDQVFLNNKSILNILSLKNDFSLKFLLAYLNSKLISFYHIRKTVKGNRLLFPKLVIKDLKEYPVPKISPEQQQPFTNLVDYILFGKEHTLKLQAAYFEQLIDGLVFELYFADEIAAANKPIFKHLGELKPITDTLTTEEKRTIIQSEFDRLYDPSHPVRNHLETLDSVEEVRIIKEALK